MTLLYLGREEDFLFIYNNLSIGNKVTIIKNAVKGQRIKQKRRKSLYICSIPDSTIISLFFL